MDKQIVDKLVKFGLITNVGVDASKYETVDDLIKSGVVTVPGARARIMSLLSEDELQNITDNSNENTNEVINEVLDNNSTVIDETPKTEPVIDETPKTEPVIDETPKTEPVIDETPAENNSDTYMVVENIDVEEPTEIIEAETDIVVEESNETEISTKKTRKAKK